MVCLLYIGMTNFFSQNFVPCGSQLAVYVVMCYTSTHALQLYILANQLRSRQLEHESNSNHLTIVIELLRNTVVSCRYVCACKLYTSTEATITNVLKFTSRAIQQTFIKLLNILIEQSALNTIAVTYKVLIYVCGIHALT